MSLQTHDTAWLRDWLKRHSANDLAPEKDYLFTTRLGAVARDHDLRGPADVVARLRTHPRGPLAEAVIDAMTTNETSFFRDQTFFRALESDILPALIEARRAERSLTVWSAACSTGQEVYSVAMLMRERFPELDRWKLRFIATDLSRHALNRAREARYTRLEVGRGLPESMRARYLRPAGADWTVDPHIQRSVEFHQLNLDRVWPALPSVDLLLIRNVLIYFDPETRVRVLTRCGRQLSRGGMLVVGAQERIPADCNLSRKLLGGYPVHQARGLLDGLL